MTSLGGIAATVADLLHVKSPTSDADLQEALLGLTQQLRAAKLDSPHILESSSQSAAVVSSLLQDLSSSKLYSALAQGVHAQLTESHSMPTSASIATALVTASAALLSFAADALGTQPGAAKALLSSCLEVNIDPAQSSIIHLLKSTSRLSDAALASACEQFFAAVPSAAVALYRAEASAVQLVQPAQGKSKSQAVPAALADRLRQLVSLARLMLDTAVHLPQPSGAASIQPLPVAAASTAAAGAAASSGAATATLHADMAAAGISALALNGSKQCSSTGSVPSQAAGSAAAIAACIVQSLQLLQALAAHGSQEAPSAASTSGDDPPEPSAAEEAAAAQRSVAVLEAIGGPAQLMNLLEGVLLSGGMVSPMHQAAPALLRELSEHASARRQLYTAPAQLLSLSTTYRKFIQHHTAPRKPAPSSSPPMAAAAAGSAAAAAPSTALAVMQQLATSESKQDPARSNGQEDGSAAPGRGPVAGLSEEQLRMMYRLSSDILRCVSLDEPSEENGTLAALLPVLCGLAQLLAVTAEPAAVAHPALGGVIASAAEKFAYLAGFMMNFGDGVMYRSAAVRLADGVAATTTFAASVQTDAEWPLPLHIMKLLFALSQGAINPVAAALYRHAGFMDAAANFAEAYRSRVEEVAAQEPALVAFVKRMGQGGIESSRLMQVVLRSLIEYGSPTNTAAAARIAEVLSLCHLAGPPVGCWYLGCTNLAGIFESSSASYSRCGACRMAAYCSPECQRKDWAGPDGHKVQCKKRLLPPGQLAPS